jgi:hypothetical protein
MNWPVGSQYADVTGKGSFVGIADEILSINKLRIQKKETADMVRLMRTVEMREYKRESRERPTKRMTEAMKSIVKYIAANPGVERAEILKVVFNFSVISPSSLGSNLNSLIAQKIITSNGRTTKRKFYVIGANND